ncbi:MAG: hypothetical protein QME16_00070 [Planctomycetota bacterium]|nr:hypothetical protein [Planctomycetota bacterium]
MAQSPINVIAGQIPAFAYESITVDDTVKSLTSLSYTDTDGNTAVNALITIETAQIRWRIDGGNPTSTGGHLSNPMDIIKLNNASDVKNFKATRVSSTSATIRVSYSG